MCTSNHAASLIAVLPQVNIQVISIAGREARVSYSMAHVWQAQRAPVHARSPSPAPSLFAPATASGRAGGARSPSCWSHTWVHKPHACAPQPAFSRPNQSSNPTQTFPEDPQLAPGHSTCGILPDYQLGEPGPRFDRTLVLFNRVPLSGCLDKLVSQLTGSPAAPTRRVT